MSIAETARAAHQAGCAIIPIVENKKPSIRWAEYQQHRPSIQRLNHWLRSNPAGIAVLGGAISGNLEILDFDDPHAWAEFAHPPPNIAELIDRIRQGYEEETPKGGRHLIYRIDGKPVPGNTKLAADPNGEVRIETRGEGGYAVIAPSSGTAHPSGNPWTIHHGSINTIATITAAEHTQLIAYCQSFDQNPTAHHTHHPPTSAVQNRPGDQWNRTCTIDQFTQLLTQDGWHIHPHLPTADRIHATRPSKDPKEGPSANIRVDPDDNTAKLYVHSTNAPIPANTKGTAYTPFGYLTTTRGGPQSAIQWLRTNGHLDTPTPWNPFDHNPDPPQHNLEVRTISEALADTTPTPPELVAGLIRTGEATIIGAPRGIGKSFLGMQLALMLAAGKGDLFDRHRILRPSRVLYCHGELDPFSARDRWQRMLTSPTWTHVAPPTPPQGLSETFTPWRIDLRKTRTTQTTNGITTTTETATATIDPRLEQHITNQHTQVIILDPWASYHGGSENSNDDTEAVLAELRRITLTHHTTIIIIAHFGKNTDTRDPEDLWRGASRLPDWAANRITLTEHYTKRQRADLQLSRKQARHYLNVTYLRRGAPVDDHSIRRDHDGFWHDWQPEAEHGGRPAEHQVADLLKALADNGGEFASLRTAADVLGTTHHTITRIIEEAGTAVEIFDGPRNSQGIRIANYAPDAPVRDDRANDRATPTAIKPLARSNPQVRPQNEWEETPSGKKPPASALTSTNDWVETPSPTGTDTPPPERRGAQSPEPDPPTNTKEY